jgi:hypothetical protein
MRQDLCQQKYVSCVGAVECCLLEHRKDEIMAKLHILLVIEFIEEYKIY